MRTAIGECLRQSGVVSEADLEAALAEHRRTGERLGIVLVRMHLATERQVAEALAFQLGFAYVDVADALPDPAALIVIPRDIAQKHGCVAVALEQRVLTVAMSDPLLFTVVRDLEFQTGYTVRQVVATRTQILTAIQTWYPATALARVPEAGPSHLRPGAVATRDAVARPRPASGAGDDVFERPKTTATERDSAPIVEMIDLVIETALSRRASDIHIEPADRVVVVRQRLDGLLKEVLEVPKWMHEGLVARIKIMAGLDIAEKRRPQDGRIQRREHGEEIDLRVSTLRTIFGEKVVLRVLDHRKGVPRLDELGMSGPAMDQTRFFLRHQHGMILVVGPTGSGKTTTLSAALSAIRSEHTNIVTVEDPVEYQIRGVNQTQINTSIELTFASALRAILRQDPDVLLVGEIRDQETARMAMQAAQTGHLVLSTLHTDDAPSCVTRLTDIGIEPYVTASALVGVIAQRLVRRLCMDCRRPYRPEAETIRGIGLSERTALALTFYAPAGCGTCNGTGYRGRVGIYEVMEVTGDLRQLIAREGGEAELREAALASGMIGLGEDGLLKVTSGVTSPDELLRVVTRVTPRAQCETCRSAVRRDFAACPGCGEHLAGACRHCRRVVERGWRFCPYCTAALQGEASSRPRPALS